ncbi:hypothetical protein HMPREF9237_01347 [Actinotignum schaalii FB123-CNA-2]|uniref:Glucose/Sorbosone dehydrogenase domain-containing protein n=1 Tax=Actinotignum schaalii FB123-CNA-2 TaxID=883067 RepID=S2VH41_9ACTO|nr:hypothetical protein HMPREF9237_01347 [Actinotignum schaalii FB123-CNA-2]
MKFRAIPATVATIVAALMTSHATGVPFSGTPAPHPTPGVTTAQDASDQAASEAPEPGTGAADPEQPEPVSPVAPSPSAEEGTAEGTDGTTEPTPVPDTDTETAEAATPLDRAQKSWREQLGILEQPEGTPRDGSASPLTARPNRFAPRNVRQTSMEQCSGRGFYSMSSGTGEINSLTIKPNGQLGYELVGRVEWKGGGRVEKQVGYDALAIAADGSMWHTEKRGTTKPGTNPETWISHGRISNTGDQGYQNFARYKIIGPGMPINGGAMDPDGRYLVVGDANRIPDAPLPPGKFYSSKRKLMVYDPGTRRMVVLGYLNTSSISSSGSSPG